MSRVPKVELVVACLLLVACVPAAVPSSALSPTPANARTPLPQTSEATQAAFAPTALPTATPVAAARPASPLVRFATNADDKNLTPWTQGTGYPGYYMMTLIYDTLFWPDPHNVPQPWLVKGYTLSPDGLQWTLNLNSGVTWQDGQPLTSDDVKFTFDYLTKYPRPRFTPTFASIDQITTPDPLTVVIQLKQPDASFLWRPLADLPILPRHIWEPIDNPLQQTTILPIGSGPYKLADYTPGQSYRFVANASYFRGKPLVDEIVMPLIAEPATTFQALRSGEIDAMSIPLSPELLQDFEQTPGMKVLRGPDFRGWYLYINTQRAPFDRKEVRQALAAIINPQALVDTILLGVGVAGVPGFAHPAVTWADPSLKRPTGRDEQRARSLLDSVSFTVGADGVRQSSDGRRLEFDLLVTGNQPVALRTAELISQWAAGVGFKLTPVSLDATALSNRLWPDEQWGQFKGDYYVGLQSWASSVQLDPNYLRDMFDSDSAIGGLNRAAYKNPGYDSIAQEQARTADPDKRKQLLYQLQQILADDVPMVPLFFPDGLHAYRPQGFDGWVYYDGVGILNKASLLPTR